MTDFERKVLGEALEKLNPNNNAIPAPDYYKAFEEATTLREATIKTSAGETKVDIIEAKDRVKPSAVMLNFYGAGYTNPHFAGNTWYCRRIAAECHMMVIDVYYTLGQVAGFPTQWEEAYDVIKYVHDHADELGIDKDKIMICGDSSGACICSGVTQMVRDRKEVSLALTLLVYGGYDQYHDPNLRPGAEASSRNRIRMTMMFDTPEIAADVRVSPLLHEPEELAGLNDIYMVCGKADFLYEENLRYASLLIKAGNTVNFRAYDDSIHGFICRWTGKYEEAISDIKHAILGKLAVIDLKK